MAVIPLRVRAVEPDEAQRFVDIRNAVTPDWGTSLGEMAWEDATYPGGVRFLAELDGRPVGVANAGRIHVMPPDHPDWWAQVTVLEADRRRGVGAALLAAVSEAAGRAGKAGLFGPVSADAAESISFLEHRGFTIHERSSSVRLELGAAAEPAVEPPPGVRLVTLADRPDLVPGVHAVALATFADIPGGDDPMAAGDLAEFRARDVDRPGIALDGFAVALAGEHVVGYASVLVDPARPSVAFHDMTTVLRAWRGRGVATALKAATIAWAKCAGLEALETGNDEANTAMRAVNARLGYQPLPDRLFYRGPLVR